MGSRHWRPRTRHQPRRPTPQAAGRFRGDRHVAGLGPGEPDSEQKSSVTLTLRLSPAPQEEGRGVPATAWPSPARAWAWVGVVAEGATVRRSGRIYVPREWTPQGGVPGAGCRRRPRCGGVCRTCCRAPSWPASGAFRRQTAPRTSSPCLPAEQTDRAAGQCPDSAHGAPWACALRPRGGDAFPKGPSVTAGGRGFQVEWWKARHLVSRAGLGRTEAPTEGVSTS